MRITIEAPDGPEADGSWALTHVEVETEHRTLTFDSITTFNPMFKLTYEDASPPTIYHGSSGIWEPPSFLRRIVWSLNAGGEVIGEAITRLKPVIVPVESTTPDLEQEAPADDVRPADTARPSGVQRPICSLCGGDAYVVRDGPPRIFCRSCQLVVGKCRCVPATGTPSG